MKSKNVPCLLGCILFVALVSRVFLAIQNNTLWWDSYVYLAMGEFLTTNGALGIWEHIRPPLFPLLLSFGSFFNQALLWNSILQITLSLGSGYLLYQITKHHFSKKIALVSTTLFLFSSVFFFLITQVYTEILALFFILLAYSLFLKKKWLWTGITIGLAFLAKFPSGIFLLVFGSVLLYRKEWKKVILLSAGFASIVLVYLLTNLYFYHAALLPIIEGSTIINQVLGCNVLYVKPWYFYFSSLWISNPLLICSVFGIGILLKKRKEDYYKKKTSKEKKEQKKKKQSSHNHPNHLLLLFLSLIVPMVYFFQLTCKDHRYTLFFLPFVCIFAAYGICSLFQKKEKWTTLLIMIVLVISIINAFSFSIDLEKQNKNAAHTQVISLLKNSHNITEPLFTTHPLTVQAQKIKNVPVYYPFYDKSLALRFETLLKKEKQYTVYIDTCNGGMLCHPDDKICHQTNKKILDFLQKNTQILYEKKVGSCLYLISSS